MRRIDYLIVGIACFFGLATAFLAGAKLGYNAGQAELAKLKAAHEKAQADTIEKALFRLRAAQARGDFLEEQLAKSERARETQREEHAREIKRLTTGRPCLNAGTVRLLNQSGSGIQPVPVPAPAGGAPAADGAAAPDPFEPEEAEVATDTDVALWIDGAKGQYETCRSRLQALIDWWKE